MDVMVIKENVIKYIYIFFFELLYFFIDKKKGILVCN